MMYCFILSRDTQAQVLNTNYTQQPAQTPNLKHTHIHSGEEGLKRVGSAYCSIPERPKLEGKWPLQLGPQGGDGKTGGPGEKTHGRTAARKLSPQ